MPNNETKESEGGVYSQIPLSKNFIEQLLKKLKVGNSRSIHLNAVPGRAATRLDLSQLSLISEIYPTNFLEKLLSESDFTFEINFDAAEVEDMDSQDKRTLSQIAKRLDNIVAENTDNFLEYGAKTFSFGYPLIVKRDVSDPDKVIKAPLFVWNLEIETAPQKRNTWKISRTADSPIRANELLNAHIQNDEGFDVHGIPEEVLGDGIIDSAELRELCTNFLSQFGIDKNYDHIKLELCPTKETLDQIATVKPIIQWSGIFGIYVTQKDTIIHATEEILDNVEEFEKTPVRLVDFQKIKTSSVNTDPSKEEILNTLTRDEVKLIQGPPGTGKSQSITAIIGNTVINGGKVLVVCEKKTALDVVMRNLEKESLDRFAVVIDDIQKDRNALVKKAREKHENRQWRDYDTTTRNEDFVRENKILKQLITGYNQKHKNLLKESFGPNNWKELIGKYLSVKRDFAALSNNVELKKPKIQFLYDYDEYNKIRDTVSEFEVKLSFDFISARNAFGILQPNYFKDPEDWASRKKLFDSIELFSEALAEASSVKLQENEIVYSGVRLGIESALTTKEVLKKMRDIAEALTRFLSEARNTYSAEINDKSLLFRIKSTISSRARDVLVLRQNIKDSLDKVEAFATSLVSRAEYFSEQVEYLKSGIDTDFLSISDKALLLEEELDSDISKIEEILERLMSFKEKDKELDAKYPAQFVEKYKQTDMPLSFDEYYGYLNSLKQTLERLIGQVPSLTQYHSFVHAKNALAGTEKQVIDWLIDSEIDGSAWLTAFDSMYLNEVILNTYEAKYHLDGTADLQRLSAQYDKVKDEAKNYAVRVCNQKTASVLKSYGGNFKTLFNLRKNNAGPKNSLRRIYEREPALFSGLFPIILTNPSAANAFLPMRMGLFDVVIFDEASQLRIEDTFATLLRGQYKIVAGDEHQMPPSSYFAKSIPLDEGDLQEEDTEVDEDAELSSSESLLDYSSKLKSVNKSSLDFHYRSEHPALISFSNAAFYGGNLVPFPEKYQYKPIDFRHINGVFKDGVNIKEVVEVIKILETEIEASETGQYPSVGVATFNIQQRNAILEAIHLHAMGNPEFRTKYQGLLEAGLFVKNLENIQGDERDIIILSTTYGKKPDQSFIQNFARLNRKGGYKLLNVIVTRAKSKIFVCTSIPKSYYEGYAQELEATGNDGKGILYAYLAYAQAVSEERDEIARSILEELQTRSHDKMRVYGENVGLSESPFEEEVYIELQKEFPQYQITQQYKVGGFRLDFLMKVANTDIVIECDGKAYHQSEEAYAHDMSRQKELEGLGFKVFRIWSTNWFQNSTYEIQKLKAFVKQYE